MQVGNTKLMIVMWFVFRKSASILRKTEKNHFTVGGLRIARLESQISGHLNKTHVQTGRAHGYILALIF